MIDWPDTRGEDPPRGDPYRSAVWLLGRHRRLATVVSLMPGAVYIDNDGAISLDVDHLNEVFAAAIEYGQAWDDYERRGSVPEDDAAFFRWQDAGPSADDFAVGLGWLLTLPSSDAAALWLLTALGTSDIPVMLGDLADLGAHGQQLLSDWCRALRAAQTGYDRVGAGSDALVGQEGFGIPPLPTRAR